MYSRASGKCLSCTFTFVESEKILKTNMLHLGWKVLYANTDWNYVKQKFNKVDISGK